MTKPFTFKGRALRSEYWWFFLLDIAITAIAVAIDVYLLFLDPSRLDNPLTLSPFEFFTVWWALLALFPRLSVTIRRLHDGGFSGFWYLLVFVPLGYLVVFILCMLPSDPQDNSYGPPPMTGGGGSPRGTPGQSGAARKDPLQAYSVLFELERKATPEYRAAFEERRKAEVRALYEQRVLGKTSEA